MRITTASPRSNTECAFIHGVCLSEMRAIPAESIVVVVTSPPYNLGIRYSEFNDTTPREEYLGVAEGRVGNRQATNGVK